MIGRLIYLDRLRNLAESVTRLKRVGVLVGHQPGAQVSNNGDDATGAGAAQDFRGSSRFVLVDDDNHVREELTVCFDS